MEPGDQLHLHVQMLRMKAGIFKFDAQAKVQDEVVVQAELTCAMRSISGA